MASTSLGTVVEEAEELEEEVELHPSQEEVEEFNTGAGTPAAGGEDGDEPPGLLEQAGGCKKGRKKGWFLKIL